MPNCKPCGGCLDYWPQEKGVKGGKRHQLPHGYCLDRTIFASNKPGDNVYPPRAKTAELPDGRHIVILVYANQVEATCQKYRGANQ